MILAGFLKESIVLFGLIWAIYFFKKISNYKKLTDLSVLALLFSIVFLSTNYQDFWGQINFPIYRNLSKGIGVIFIAIFFYKLFKHRVKLYSFDFALIFFFFLTSILLSYVFNEVDNQIYFHYLRNFVYVALLFTGIYFFLSDKDRIKEVVIFYFGMLILVSVFILTQFIWDFDVNGILYYGNAFFGHRIAMHFSNPNYLAFIFLPAIPILLFSKILSVNKVILFILFLSSILITGSKAALVSTLVVIIMSILTQKKYAITKFSFLFFIGILLFGLTKLPILTNMEFNGFRLIVAKISLNGFLENPLNGIGYGQFRVSQWKYVDEDVIKQKNWEIDDIMLGKFKDLDLKTKRLVLENQNNVLKDFSLLDDQEINDLHLSEKFKSILSDKGITESEKMTHNDFLTVIVELGSLGLLALIFSFYKIYTELKKLKRYSVQLYIMSFSISLAALIFSLFHNNLTSLLFWLMFLNVFFVKKYIIKQ